MNVFSEKPDGVLRPCLGVLCELHHRCARYVAVDGTRWPSSSFIGCCADSHGARPMFVPIERGTSLPKS